MVDDPPWKNQLGLTAAFVYTFVLWSVLCEMSCNYYNNKHLSPVKRICVFEHSDITNFNCACPAIQRGQGSGFLSEGSSWLTACMSEQRRFWRDCIGNKYQIRLTWSSLIQNMKAHFCFHFSFYLYFRMPLVWNCIWQVFCSTLNKKKLPNWFNFCD